MGVVRIYMSSSLDGFVADRNGDSSVLYSDLRELRNSEALRELIASVGAVVMGKRSYEMGDTEEGYLDYEHQVPIFVVTHDVPAVPAKHDPTKGLTFTFVTDGVASAVEQAQAAAGERDVQVIGGANTAQQLIRERLVDEIQISLVPVLLGEGLRLFEHLGPERLEKIKVVDAPVRTDVRFRVVRDDG